MSRYPESIDKITKARLAFSTLGSIFSIALTMFFVGILVFLVYFSTMFLNGFSEKMEMEVLFFSQEDAGVKEADIVAYEQSLKLQNFIQTSRVSTQKDNTEEAKRVIGNNYEEVIVNPINASIILTLKPEYTNADSINKVIKYIKQNEMVQDVEYPDYIVQVIQGNFTKIQWTVLGICSLFLLISLLLIGNSLRLSIYAKRFNIRSMLLVGATRGFVRRPFVFKGLVQGTWGGFIALILLSGALYSAHYLQLLPGFIDLSNTTVIACCLGGIFVFSILFTMLSAILFVNKYIKINSDRLYL
ncbi:MAG: hypothetical protein PHQ33_01280 [Bacteroidales bacterium]|jgi:cell division transport system permease protein|nr:hypothetical protein [Bacteroidales bacterium]MDD4394505.1 hypothetical protein [Bacteroidales bacterium]